jgi:hypothetical protein
MIKNFVVGKNDLYKQCIYQPKIDKVLRNLQFFNLYFVF